MNLFTDLSSNIFKLTEQQGWELAAWTMCYFLAAGTGVALAGALLRLLCKRTTPQIRYAVSLVTLTALAVLPIGISMRLYEATTPDQPTIGTAIAVPPLLADSPAPPTIDLKYQQLPQAIQFPEAQPRQATPHTGAASSLPIAAALRQHTEPTPASTPLVETIVSGTMKYLPWLWIVGTPLTFLLLCTGLVGSERIRKQSQLLTTGPLYEAAQRLARSLSVSRRVGIAINERIASPLLVGIVRPMILLPPAALTGWSPEEIEMVLLHELAHVRRWDNLVNLLQRVVESLLFFHPCVWWVSRWVRHDREECCDAVVVARTAQPQAYAELLVALATPQPMSSAPLAGLAMAQHPLAGRIRRILHLEEEKMLISRGTFTLAGAALAGLLIALLWTPVDLTGAEEKQPVAVEEKAITTQSAESEEVEFDVQDEFTKTFPDDTGADGGSEFAASLKAKGKQVHISKNKDGTVSGLEHHAPTPVQPPPSVFPTLEDQRAADLAYKLLGIDFERLGKDDLARVKAMKFQGGLKAVAGALSSQDGIRKDDILVGLHAWPTTSMADVKTILSRDDLEELSPLKFYVIRRTTKQTAITSREMEMISGQPSGGRGGYGRSGGRGQDGQDGTDGVAGGRGGIGGRGGEGGAGGDYGDGGHGRGFGGGEFGGGFDESYGGGRAKVEAIDELITGRIKVNILDIKRNSGAATYNKEQYMPPPNNQTPTLPPVPTQPLSPPSVLDIPNQPNSPWALVDAPLAPTTLSQPAPSEPVHSDYSKWNDARPATPPDVSTSIATNTAKLAETNKKIEAARRELKYAQGKHQVAQKSYEAKIERNKAARLKGEDLATQKARVQSEAARFKVQHAQAVLNDRIQAKSAIERPTTATLLYDNKTFDEWRTLWKNELKTERRTEAIRAMAAFGRAGYGKEAAEAILDVAGEYDFSQESQKPVSGLKNAIYEVLQGVDSLPNKLWFPMLVERLENDPKRWSGLVIRTFGYVGVEDPDIYEMLRSVSQNPDYLAEVRAAAFRGLVSCDFELKQPSTVDLLREAISGQDLKLIHTAMTSLNFNHLDKLPEQFDLLLNPNEEIAAIARRAYSGCSEENGTVVLKKLIALLNDPVLADDHRNAIRAIATKAQTLSNSGSLFGGSKRELPNKEQVVQQLREILVDGDRELLVDAIIALKMLTNESESLVIQQVEGRVNPKRRGELAAAAKTAKKPVSGGGLGRGGGGGYF